MGIALLRCQFIYIDLIKWLGGEYTHAYRNWDEAFEAIEQVRHAPIPPGYPPVDFDRARRVCEEGAPLAGHFECKFADMVQRERYDNHPPLTGQADPVRAKLAKEEEKSFHLLLPRFFVFFIFGLFINPLTWVMRNGKGRLCVDSSSSISEEDTAAANDQIPRAGAEGRDNECPAVHLASAFMRHATRIWRLRIAHPKDDILQFKDDIDAAFHRCLYHPALAIVFAYVFMEFLIIPLGLIFGARNSPSWWCLLSEVRAHFAAHGDFSGELSDLASAVDIVTPPTLREQASIVPAVADALHQGVTVAEDSAYHHSTFVDDNATVDLRPRIRQAINSSVVSAFIMFGYPAENPRRPPVLSEEKWIQYTSHVLEFLGFDIDTRRMTVSWPIRKRLALKSTLFDEWLSPADCRRRPREIASVLGIIRNAAFVAPTGIYLSVRLQFLLNDVVTRYRSRSNSRWWRTHLIRIPQSILEDIRLLYDTLTDNPEDKNWCRYIGFIVPRVPTQLIYSDASYGGLGGWSSTLDFMWRLSRDDLVRAGFDMRTIDDTSQEPDIDASGHHINILEFLAIIINLFVALRRLHSRPAPRGGDILSVLADNTSALSWLTYASRSRRPAVQRLARFCSALLFFDAFQGKLTASHIAGARNEAADALSRPQLFPTWASVIAQCSHLSGLQAYQVPSELLSVLSSLVSSKPTEATYATLTTRLLSLELRTLRTGSSGTATTTSASRR